MDQRAVDVIVGGATGGGLAMTGAPIAIAIVSAIVL